MTATDWLAVGSKVAVYTPGRGDEREVRVCTVDRLTRVTVLLSNGVRYRLPRLTRSIGSWSPTERVLPLTDPDVVRALARQRRVRAARDVEALMGKWRSSDDDEYAHEALRVLAHVVDNEDAS